MNSASFRTFGLGSMLSLALVAAAPAKAEGVKFGGRVGYYTDIQEAFLGAEVLVPVARRVYFNPNIEWVLVDDVTYFTLNADFHYDFHTARSTFLWLGGGIGISKYDPDGPDNGETDLAANFLGGIGFRTGAVIPYFQAKVIAKSDTEVALAFGLRF